MSTTTSVLDNVIETLKDGHEGFRSAAAEAPSPALKTLFGEYSLQRNQFAGELQGLARSAGERDPADTGSVAGAVHRGWINLKAAVSKQDAHAILAECERGEDVAIESYKKALGTPDLPSHIADTLKHQLEAVEAAHIRIRGLRDELAPK